MKSVPILGWTWSIVPAVLLIGAEIAYAGQPGNSGNSIPTPNPCSLLSAAEVGAAAGEAIKDGVILFRNGSTASCSFARTRGGRIAILIRRPPSREWTGEQVERMRRGVSLGSYREVDGVGERAFILDLKDAAAVLCVFESPYYLQVSVLGAGDGSRKTEVVERLARIALRRLAPVTTKNGAISIRGSLPIRASTPGMIAASSSRATAPGTARRNAASPR